MKCATCDKALNDYEATRQAPEGGFYDLCSRCYGDYIRTLRELEEIKTPPKDPINHI